MPVPSQGHYGFPASDKVYQLLVHGRWFSPGTLASSATKTRRHDIAEILLKVALNTIKQTNQYLDISYLHESRRKPEYPERTTDHGQATGKLYHLRM
jgi:hypothetical protein